MTSTLALIMAAVVWLPQAAAFNFFPKTEPYILTVTDVSEEGKKWPQASPDAPVYYEAISFGSQNFQGLHGDPAPSNRQMTNLLVKELEKQGFVLAKQKGQATIFLSISWGYSRANLGVLGFLGGEKMDLMWETSSLELGSNLWRRNFRSPEAELIMQAAGSDLYIASIKAYDLKKLDAGTEVILWHTRVACESRGLSMRDTMPQMILAGAQFAGRDIKPIWRDPMEVRKGDVKIGESEVIEYTEAPKAGDSRK
jgi:hypothetical protein